MTAERSLYEQYLKLFDLFEKYSPELCITMMSTVDVTDLEEFHHTLWELPFYQRIYHIESESSLFKKTDIFCKIDNDNSKSETELFQIEMLTLEKKWFKKEIVAIRKQINLATDSFDAILIKILTLKPVAFYELPEKLRERLFFVFV